jgi:hypothetical protein
VATAAPAGLWHDKRMIALAWMVAAKDYMESDAQAGKIVVRVS